MNGATPGTWNAQGGYGLINAIDALNAVDLLRVQSTSPANGATVTTAPELHPGHLQQAGRLLDPLRRRPDLHRVPRQE